EQLYEKAKLKKNYPLNNIASLYLKQGNYETATEYVEKALKIGKAENDKKGLGESYDILGQIEQKKGNYQNALSYFRNAYQIKSAFDNQTDLIASYNYLGNVYELLGNFKEALVNYRQTIALCEKLGTRNGLAFAYLHGSTIAYSQNNLALAESQVKRSIEIAKRNIGEHQLEKGLFTLADIDAENLKNGYYVISNIYSQKGNYAMATHAFVLAKNLSDSLSNSEIARTLANMRTKFEIDNKNTEIEDLTFVQNQQNALLTLKKRQRNVSFIGACLLLIATTILVYTVIEKGRKNILLEQKYTEFELLQFKIEKQNVELTQQNITKDKLFSIISHDIRTPINGLKSMLTLLNASQIPTFLLSDLSEKLQKNIDNVSTTIDNLLNWSVSQMNGIETHPQNVRVGDIAIEIEKMYQANAAAKKITLENIIDPDVFIYADPDHLRLLLRNLVGNALKFTPLGGKIILSSVVFSNGQLAISITDTGVGMSAEKLSKLFRVETHFTEYGTAKEKGAGLGLLLCKEFAEKNKGSIWVTSEEGKGSTFSFSLPLVTNPQFAQLA
ncbi:MAG: ATP-binding protein, partial [Bacteroidia bacterium]